MKPSAIRKAGPLATLAGALMAAAAFPASAGPPYVTDDPEPTEPGGWEIYSYVEGAHIPGETAGETGLDINYGAAKDVQLTLTVPVAFEDSESTHVGAGDVEVGVKYLFLHQQEGGWMPDVAAFPTLTVPTAKRRFGSRRVGVFLPIWAQKDIGPWSVFGGGGYQINPGPENLDFWESGIGVTRAVSERLTIGGEVYHVTREAVDSEDFTGLNLGLAYQATKHVAVLASGGPGLQNTDTGGKWTAYLGLGFTY